MLGNQESITPLVAVCDAKGNFLLRSYFWNTLQVRGVGKEPVIICDSSPRDIDQG